MTIKVKKFPLTLLFFCIFIMGPRLVFGDCTCDKEDEASSNKSEALKYKMGGIASILVASGVGVVVPIFGKTVPSLQSENNVFLFVKSFAAGVILSTGFIHVLPDAFESLTSPCLAEKPWGKFPFSGLIAMVGTMLTLMIDVSANSYFASRGNIPRSNNGDEEKAAEPTHVQANHGHAHGSFAMAQHGSNYLRQRVVTQVLEAGIIVHSVIIGLSLGASGSVDTIRPLVAALTFHQFFEGMGLGSCISEAKFKLRAVAMMVLFFSLTTPIGIAVGIGVTNLYKENSPHALIVQGILDALSAGILIYMALVDLLAADLLSPKLQSNPVLQFGANVFLVLGATFMAVLAIWA